MNVPDHRRWEEDAAAHALGALDGHEATAFEAHLEVCEDCRMELVRLMSTVELLPASVEQVAPPPSLRRDLMATVRAEAARPSGSGSGDVARRFRFPRLLPAAGIAAVLAVAVAVALVVGDGGSDPGRTVPVEAMAAGEISAALVEEDDSWTLEVEHLPEIPAGTVYKVWVRDSAGLRPSRAFVLTGDGAATVSMREPLHDGDEVMVTHERRRDASEPTSAPLLRARI